MNSRRAELREASTLGLILLAYLLLSMGLRQFEGLLGFYLDLLSPSLWLLGATLVWRRRAVTSFTLEGGPRAASLAWICGAACGGLVVFALVYPPATGGGGVVHDTLGRLALVLLVPVAEELYFRGAMLGHLVRAVGRGPATLLTSALFGFLHLPQGVAVVGVMFALSFVLCLVTLRSRSVLWAVGLHVVWNGLAALRALPLDQERLIVTAAVVGAMIALIVAGVRSSRPQEVSFEQLEAPVEGPSLQRAGPR